MQIAIWAIVSTIFFNVLANLLTPSIQKYIGRLSESLKQKSETRKRIFENSVQYLIDNPQEQIYLRIRYMERTILSFIFLITGYLSTISNNTFLVITGIILFILGNYGLRRSRNMEKLCEEIIKRRKEKHPEINLD